MLVISIEKAKSNLNELLEEANNCSSPILITNNNGQNCYLISEKYFNAVLETIHLSSIEGLVDSIIEEGKTPYKKTVSSEDLKW